MGGVGVEEDEAASYPAAKGGRGWKGGEEVGEGVSDVSVSRRFVIVAGL